MTRRGALVHDRRPAAAAGHHGWQGAGMNVATPG
jgi:hypothetical protein